MLQRRPSEAPQDAAFTAQMSVLLFERVYELHGRIFIGSYPTRKYTALA
jgi:hypothetical protein